VFGRVLPSTLTDVRLRADLSNGDGRIHHVSGETQIRSTEGLVQRLWLDPANTPAFPPAISAVLGADLIIIGPGSLKPLHKPITQFVGSGPDRGSSSKPGNEIFDL